MRSMDDAFPPVLVCVTTGVSNIFDCYTHPTRVRLERCAEFARWRTFSKKETRALKSSEQEGTAWTFSRITEWTYSSLLAWSGRTCSRGAPSKVTARSWRYEARGRRFTRAPTCRESALETTTQYRHTAAHHVERETVPLLIKRFSTPWDTDALSGHLIPHTFHVIGAQASGGFRCLSRRV